MGKERGEVIFWADDEADNPGTLIRQVLEENGHKITYIARSVEDVDRLTQKEETRFTVAVIDGRMPNVGDGQRTARIIRKRRKGVRVISFSAEKQNWGDDHLDKGNFNIENILRAITDSS